MKHTRIPILTLVVVGCARIAFAQPEVERLIAAADPAIQAQIGTTFNAFLSGERSELKTNWQGFRELKKLKEVAGDDEQLVKQLAIYAVAVPRVEEHQVIGVLHILQVLDLKPSIPIRVLAPYLDSDNRLLRGFVRDWFESHDSHGLDGSPLPSANYRDYVDYINRTLNMHDEVPTAFVEYIYERSPDQALLVYLRVDRRDETIARLHAIGENLEAARQGRQARKVKIPQRRDQQREFLLAAHVVDNAIWLKENEFDEQLKQALPEAQEQLAKLSEHDQWWVRLYVAEIMRRHRELRLADVLDKLSEDANPSVSKAAKAAKG